MRRVWSLGCDTPPGTTPIYPVVTFSCRKLGPGDYATTCSIAGLPEYAWQPIRGHRLKLLQSTTSSTNMFDQPRRERMLNVPTAIVVLLAVLALVQLLLMFVLTPEQTTEFLLLFAFIPARYDTSVLPDLAWPGGWAADVWTFVTYALIHADLSHLIFNAVWLLAFGSPVAQRFGSLRFIPFMALTAAAGAAVHLVTHFGELLPMVGASAAISGAMAAATRFVFQHGGPLEFWRDRTEACRVPAAPLADSLRDARVLAFLAVWFGINILFGVFSVGMPGVEQAIAWQAHIGGFLAGLLAFAAFDPVPTSASVER
jgi:membrane associated rhomboid family serine protease